MRIEFRYWQTNTEVALIDDSLGEGHVARNFYTSAKKMGIVSHGAFGTFSGFDARFHFEVMEEVSPYPIIGGQFGHLHPYWEKHPAQKAQMLMDRARRGES